MAVVPFDLHMAANEERIVNNLKKNKKTKAIRSDPDDEAESERSQSSTCTDRRKKGAWPGGRGEELDSRQSVRIESVPEIPHSHWLKRYKSFIECATHTHTHPHTHTCRRVCVLVGVFLALFLLFQLGFCLFVCLFSLRSENIRRPSQWPFCSAVSAGRRPKRNEPTTHTHTHTHTHTQKEHTI